ncbi:MAG: thiamine pyrophosphate-dependent dehydrogenase E1 component subunit alpha [Kiritimatiellia bacterium]|jgi:TPP-dependent pyruvate/acetoin dehydrogenase alpha subunit
MNLDLKACHARMLLIRRFEEAVERLFAEGRIGGTAHVCIGQEAVAVGVCAALGPDDALTSSHRGHGHFLARGASPRRLLAELFGGASGYAQGRGGSQMMTDLSIGFYGANGIVGGSLPFATGLALDARLRKTGRVTACLFGDGAASQGTFHESLNFAGLWKLPVVYVCENNGYAMSTSTAKGLANPNVAGRAAAYALRGVRVDGNDVEAVAEAMEEAVRIARDGGGATLLECMTYRLSGHSRGDRCVYRSREEEAEARRHEPIARLEATLRSRGLWDEACSRADARAVATVEEAVAFASADLPLDPARAAEGVYA